MIVVLTREEIEIAVKIYVESMMHDKAKLGDVTFEVDNRELVEASVSVVDEEPE